MDPLDEDVKKAVLVAEKFLSVTLVRESLSPETEKERSLLAGWFKKLKTQLGPSSESQGDDKPPPRPAKGGAPVPEPGPEEIYDDVADMQQGGEEAKDDYYSAMAEGVEGGLETAEEDGPGENYEAMDHDTPAAQESNKQDNGPAENYEAMDHDNKQDDQENYEEPQQDPADDNYEISVDQQPQTEENYEEPGAAADLDYEITEPLPSSGKESVDGAEQASVDGSLTRSAADWNHLTKNVRPGDIEGVILKGNLYKHRKKGKFFLGSKWQKRYCVLRSFVMYYFKEKNADKQQGQILLPGYKIEVTNKKGCEFLLSTDGGRSYKFTAITKEEAEKWMAAIRNVANVPMSVRHSTTLKEIRENEPSGDDDSMFYEDVASNGAQSEETADQGDEVYDDTEGDSFYEAVGSVQSTVSELQSTPKSQAIEEINYEISASQVSASPGSEPVVEENYEVPEEQTPTRPPPRPASKPPQQPEQEENYEVPEGQTPPALPPPRPASKPPQPEQEENYEVPENQTSPTPPPLRPAKSQPQQEDYEVPEEQKAPTPPRPRRPVQPPPEPEQDENYEVAEEVKPPARPSKAQPPVQEDEYELPGQDELPPAPAPIVEENYEIAGGDQPAMTPPKPVIQKRKPPVPPQQQQIPEQPKRPAPKQPAEEPKSVGMEPTKAINYANVYQALWNCEANDDDELAFERGDLIYIYEKPHLEWWIGSLFRPQGYSVGLIPKKYVMEAYELSA